MARGTIVVRSSRALEAQPQAHTPWWHKHVFQSNGIDPQTMFTHPEPDLLHFIQPAPNERATSVMKQSDEEHKDRLARWAKLFREAHRRPENKGLPFVLVRCCLWPDDYRIEENDELYQAITEILKERKVILAAGPRFPFAKDTKADLHSGWQEESRIWSEWLKLPAFELHYIRCRKTFNLSLLGRTTVLVDWEPSAIEAVNEVHFKWEWIARRGTVEPDSRTKPIVNHWRAKALALLGRDICKRHEFGWDTQPLSATPAETLRCFPESHRLTDEARRRQAITMLDFVAFNYSHLQSKEELLWNKWNAFFGHFGDEEALKAIPHHSIDRYLEWRLRQRGNQWYRKIERERNRLQKNRLTLDEMLNSIALREKRTRHPWRWAESLAGKWIAIYRGRILGHFSTKQQLERFVGELDEVEQGIEQKIEGNVLLHHFPSSAPTS